MEKDMNNIRITFEDKAAEAFDFTIADDLYIFFRFRSPNSDCEIGIAFDQLIDGGDWYENDGHLGGYDHKLVDEVLNRLWDTPEFDRFHSAVNAAARMFNGLEGRS